MQSTANDMFRQRGADTITVVRAGVGVVLLNSEGSMLLEQRSDCSLWGLPGGRIEAGESIVTAAVREVREETGFLMNVSGLLGIYSGPYDRVVTYPDNVVQLIDIIITGNILSGELTCSHESKALQFFGINELPPKAEIVPPAREPIRDYVNGLMNLIR